MQLLILLFTPRIYFKGPFAYVHIKCVFGISGQFCFINYHVYCVRIGFEQSPKDTFLLLLFFSTKTCQTFGPAHDIMVRMHVKWALSRQNLSTGSPRKRDSNQSPQLQRLARKLKFNP